MSYVSGWSDDARKAMQASLDADVAGGTNYFVWWYTVKSLGLVAALAACAYLYGRQRR